MASTAIQIPPAQERVPLNPSLNSAALPMLDQTLASVANLAKLLPTGTVLAFQSISPSFTDHGICYTSNRILSGLLIFLCTLSCIFFSFTDSLVGRYGKLYYGLATFKGFNVFNYRGTEEGRTDAFGDLRGLRIRWLDSLHALLSALVFLVVAFSDSDIQQCFSLGGNPNVKELLVNLPLGAGLLSSMVFMVFPTTRKGIGYTDTTPRSS